jgi:hypothetical protein
MECSLSLQKCYKLILLINLRTLKYEPEPDQDSIIKNVFLHVQAENKKNLLVLVHSSKGFPDSLSF